MKDVLYVSVQFKNTMDSVKLLIFIFLSVSFQYVHCAAHEDGDKNHLMSGIVPDDRSAKHKLQKSILFKKLILGFKQPPSPTTLIRDKTAAGNSTSSSTAPLVTSTQSSDDDLLPLKQQLSTLLGHTFDFSYLQEFTHRVQLTLARKPINLRAFTIDSTNLPILEQLCSLRSISDCMYVAAKLAGIEKGIAEANDKELVTLDLEVLLDIKNDVALLPMDVDKMEKELLRHPSWYSLSGRKETEDNERVKRKIVSDERELWKTTHVTYVIEKKLKNSDAARTAIEAGLAHWEAETCFNFTETADTTYNDAGPLVFRYGTGCWSYIGKLRFIEQTISLGNGCFQIKSVAHEVGHALGFRHEHSRPDRDNFVTIKFENIQQGRASNFVKHESSVIQTAGVPYDYNSVMHYPANAFSRDPNRLKTILVKDDSYTEKLSNTYGLSFADAKLANLIYCSKSCPGGLLSSKCTDGGYLDPHDCTKCKCPLGLTSCTITGPANGDVSDWSAWSKCSQPCGGCGEKTRTRTCVKEPCSQALTWSIPCNAHLCPERMVSKMVRRCHGNRCYNYKLFTTERCCGGFKQSKNQCVET